jgi:outer membrane protein TolC
MPSIRHHLPGAAPLALVLVSTFGGVFGGLAAGAATAAPLPQTAPPPSAEPSTLRLSLAEAVRRALDDGTAARLATSRIGEAEARALEARSALQPQLSLGGLGATESINLETFGFPPQPGQPPVVGPFYVVDAHVTLAMNVIDLAARRRWQAAQAGLKVSAEDRQRVANDVAGAVAALYVAVGRSAARIDAINADVALFEKLRQLADDQRRAGVGTRLDTTRADVQLTRQRQALLVATNQRDLARLALLRATGAELGVELVLTDDWTTWSQAAVPLPPLGESLAAARRERPEMRLAAEKMRAATLAIEAARAERLPTLGIQAQGTESGNRARDAAWSRTLGAAVNLPLFTGRRIEAKVAQARAQQEQLEIEQRDTGRQIEAEVRQALLVWQNAKSRVELAAASERLAQDELDQASDRFRAGVAPSIEVDNAQTSHAAARDARIDAVADEVQARFDLARATGQIRALLLSGEGAEPQTSEKPARGSSPKGQSPNDGGEGR